jgi:two-component system response regulator NreC
MSSSVATTPCTVVLADDHAIVRDGLRMVLEGAAGFEVVAEAGTAQDALRYVRGHKPDVLVLDLNMPGTPSLEVLAQIPDASPGTAVVVLTMQAGTAFAREALRAGARGYVLKESAGEELVRAIEVARSGGTYLTPALGARLATEPDGPPPPPDELTPREVEVLGLLALGHTNAEIAAQLHLSRRTVETHRAHLQAKTGCASRAELVRYTIAHGLLPAAG